VLAIQTFCNAPLASGCWLFGCGHVGPSVMQAEAIDFLRARRADKTGAAQIVAVR